MSTVFLVDVSSSLVGALNRLGVCRDFYGALLSLARSLRAEAVLFPSPERRGLVTQAADLSYIQGQAERVCGPTFERGTPLLRALHETLASRLGAGAGIGTLVLVSDLLSDRSDDPELADDVAEMLRAGGGEEMVGLRLRLVVVWLKRDPAPSESPCPAIRLLRLLEPTLSAHESTECRLDELEWRLTRLHANGLIRLVWRRVDSLLNEYHVKCFVENEIRVELASP